MADRARHGRPHSRRYAAHEPRPLGARLSPQWKDLLDRMAASNGRSLGREIEVQLKRAADPDMHVLGKALMTNLGSHGATVAIAFVIMLTTLQQLCRESVRNEPSNKPWSTERWLDDPRCWGTFIDAVTHLYGDEGVGQPGRRPKPGEWDRIGPWAAATVRAKLQRGLPQEFWRPAGAAKVDKK